MDHATYVSIREKHIALIHTIDELKAGIHAPETSAQTLQSLSETLRERISDRFTEESEHALFQHLLKTAPRMQREIESLEGDHDFLETMMQKLTRRRDITTERLNAIDGISCVNPLGAFYAFPRLELEGVTDEAFCAKVIRDTGVVIVPGSGFGQRPGTQHFRVVFLPPEAVLDQAFDRIAGVVESFR